MRRYRIVSYSNLCGSAEFRDAVAEVVEGDIASGDRVVFLQDHCARYYVFEFAHIAWP